MDPDLETREVGELLYADSVEVEVDAERLERAVRTTGRVKPVALVERGPLREGPEPEHPSRQNLCVVADAEHALSSCWWGNNGDEGQCQCGYADQTTAHKFSARCEEVQGALVRVEDDRRRGDVII